MDTPEREDESKWFLKFFGSLGLMFVVVAILAIFAPGYIASGYIEKRDEIPENLVAIQKAELEYFAKHGEYLAVDSYPETPTILPNPWKESKAGAFTELGFKPKKMIRASYSVTITENDFQVLGISDVDGDNIQATYIATKNTAPSLKTNPKIY
jgi:hypothetical protein